MVFFCIEESAKGKSTERVNILLIGMTDRQSKELETLSRIDELDRMAEVTTDRDILTFISKRKKALREQIENASKH